MNRLLILFIILASFVKINAQSYTNLVFEGAGIRGLAYAGVIEVLEDNNQIKFIENVGGTSAGAITALMISIGYNATEIKEIISDTDFGEFNDGQYMFVGGIYRLKENFGWYKTEEFVIWLEEIIRKKTGDSEITFSALEKKGFKNLYITATCLNKQKLIVFSKDTYPNMKIKDAVRISMSIPIYFEATFIDYQGRIHEKPVDFKGLDIMMDGGLLGNFPIFIFDEITSDKDGNEIRIPNPKTLGFRIDSEEQIALDQQTQQLTNIDVENAQDYLIALYILILENLNRNALEKYDWDRTISIEDASISPKVKQLSTIQKESLIQCGRKGTQDFFINK